MIGVLFLIALLISSISYIIPMQRRQPQHNQQHRVQNPVVVEAQTKEFADAPNVIFLQKGIWKKDGREQTMEIADMPGNANFLRILVDAAKLDLQIACTHKDVCSPDTGQFNDENFHKWYCNETVDAAAQASHVDSILAPHSVHKTKTRIDEYGDPSPFLDLIDIVGLVERSPGAFGGRPVDERVVVNLGARDGKGLGPNMDPTYPLYRAGYKVWVLYEHVRVCPCMCAFGGHVSVVLTRALCIALCIALVFKVSLYVYSHVLTCHLCSRVQACTSVRARVHTLFTTVFIAGPGH